MDQPTRLSTPDPTISAAGYDVTPLSEEEVMDLAADLNAEERRVLLDHGTEPAFCGTLLGNKKGGDLRLPAVRAAAVRVEREVRLRHRLAQLRPAGRPRPYRVHRGPQPRHAPHRDPLRPLRRPPRPRLPRWPASLPRSLLPQLRLDGVHRGRAAPATQDQGGSRVRAVTCRGGLIPMSRSL